nr:hypothetical protein [Anaerolineae bacterium]
MYQNEKGDHPYSDGTLYINVGDWEVEINNQILEYIEQCDLELALLEEIVNEFRLFEITNRDGDLILNTRSAPISGPNQGEGEYSIAFTGGIGRVFYLAVLVQREWIPVENSEIAFGFLIAKPTNNPDEGDAGGSGSTSDTNNTSSWSSTSDQ